MKLDPDTASARYMIRSYDPGVITINDDQLTTSCVVMADTLIKDWRPQSIDALIDSDFSVITALEPEIVLLGTGRRLKFPPAKLVAPLTDNQIGVEIMDTHAACRCYCVLVAEQRRVAAALLIS